MREGTWPPSYDADDLAKSIAELTAGGFPSEEFYEVRVPGAPISQGDIVRLEAGIPIIDEDCEPSVLEDESNLWMILGNTCDIERDVKDVPYTLIAPVVILSDVEEAVLGVFKRYQYNRRFFLPAWNKDAEPGAAVEFTMQVSLDKSALSQCVTHEAALSYKSWILLNACLTRFTARADRRRTWVSS